MPDYPAWVCVDCGRKWGRRRPTHEITAHEGTCDVCGRKAIVTEPRDFGHLVKGWETARSAAR